MKLDSFEKNFFELGNIEINIYVFKSFLIEEIYEKFYYCKYIIFYIKFVN